MRYNSSTVVSIDLKTSCNDKREVKGFEKKLNYIIKKTRKKFQLGFEKKTKPNNVEFFQDFSGIGTRY